MYADASKYVMVNGITVQVIDLRALGKMSDRVRNDERWRPVPNTNWYYYLPYETRDIIIASGHDDRQIDYAVPQEWYEEYHRKHGEWPKACWSYEKGEDGKTNIFGKPLFWSTILHHLDQQMLKVWEAQEVNKTV